MRKCVYMCIFVYTCDLHAQWVRGKQLLNEGPLGPVRGDQQIAGVELTTQLLSSYNSMTCCVVYFCTSLHSEGFCQSVATCVCTMADVHPSLTHANVAQDCSLTH